LFVWFNIYNVTNNSFCDKLPWGGKPAQEVQDNERQNKTYAQSQDYTQNTLKKNSCHATTSPSATGLTCLFIAFLPLPTSSKIPYSIQPIAVSHLALQS